MEILTILGVLIIGILILGGIGMYAAYELDWAPGKIRQMGEIAVVTIVIICGLIFLFLTGLLFIDTIIY